jgi:hypothetical protein
MPVEPDDVAWRPRLMPQEEDVSDLWSRLYPRLLERFGDEVLRKVLGPLAHRDPPYRLYERWRAEQPYRRKTPTSLEWALSDAFVPYLVGRLEHQAEIQSWCEQGREVLAGMSVEDVTFWKMMWYDASDDRASEPHRTDLPFEAWIPKENIGGRERYE